MGDLLRIASTWAFQNNIYAVASQRIINRHDNHWPTVPRSDDPDLATLHRDGHVNLGNLGVDVAPLSNAFREVVDRHPQDDPDLNKINVEHPFMFHPLTLGYLRIQRLNRLIVAYLGDDATFDEVQLFRTPDCSSAGNLSSGQWHHDGNGHVLLMWVLLSDVDESCRATWYATGSHHRTLTNNQFSKSRYSDAQVRGDYPRVVQLLGNRGDVLLMDPHGYHRAAFEKGRRRDVLYLGFSSYSKGVALSVPGMNHGVGVIDDWFPSDFDPAKTLVRRERLFKEADHLLYRGHGGREPLRASASLAMLPHTARQTS